MNKEFTRKELCDIINIDAGLQSMPLVKRGQIWFGDEDVIKLLNEYGFNASYEEDELGECLKVEYK